MVFFAAAVLPCGRELRACVFKGFDPFSAHECLYII